MNIDSYSSALPYPPVDNVRPDRQFARFIMQNRAGELNAIAEYIYQSIIFGDYFPWLATLTEGISMTEMKHYEILSELIKALGVNPAVREQVRTSVINTEDDAESRAPRAAKRAIAADLADERAAAVEYRRLADSTSDSAAAAILERIAEDEEMHARLLENALGRIELS